MSFIPSSSLYLIKKNLDGTKSELSLSDISLAVGNGQMIFGTGTQGYTTNAQGVPLYPNTVGSAAIGGKYEKIRMQWPTNEAISIDNYQNSRSVSIKLSTLLQQSSNIFEPVFFLPKSQESSIVVHYPESYEYNLNNTDVHIHVNGSDLINGANGWYDGSTRVINLQINGTGDQKYLQSPVPYVQFDSSKNSVLFSRGGLGNPLELVHISGGNLRVDNTGYFSNFVLKNNYIPSSSSSFGVSGQIATDSNYFYSHNGIKWRRTALAEW